MICARRIQEKVNINEVLQNHLTFSTNNDEEHFDQD